jgi:hypothetical protein
MLHGSSTTRSERAAGAFAAGLTGAVAVFVHMAVDADPVRSAAVVALVVLIAAVRLGSAGRWGIIFSCLSGAAVAQPTLDAIARILPNETAGHATSDLGHAATDVSISAVHLLLAVLLVAAVVGAEQAFLLVIAALLPFARWLRLITSSIEPPSPARQRPTPPDRLVYCSFSAPHVLRRGPPTPSRVAS